MQAPQDVTQLRGHLEMNDPPLPTCLEYLPLSRPLSKASPSHSGCPSAASGCLLPGAAVPPAPSPQIPWQEEPVCWPQPGLHQLG